METKEKIEEKTTQGISSALDSLIHSDLEFLGRGILRSLKLFWHDQPVRTEKAPQKAPTLPVGPYISNRKHQVGDLLIWIPCTIEGHLIDDLTGGYGYSHITVDCGDTDLPTGKPVMIESTLGQPVGNKFLDQYGQRNFIRIPLSKVGIEPDKFCECVKSKFGQTYDKLEALTWGEIDDPAKQVCSDLATVCLPEEMRRDIADKFKKGALPRHSVSDHGISPKHGIKILVSPNAFAVYFGAPKGKTVSGLDQRVEPHIIEEPVIPVLHKHPWRVIAFATAGTVLGLWVWKKLREQ